MNKKYFTLLLGFLLLFYNAGCSEKQNFCKSEFIEFNESGMIPGKEYLFSQLNDSSCLSSSKLFNIVLTIRYTDQCEINVLPLSVDYLSTQTDSIENISIMTPLFDNRGENLGVGNFGFYENEIPLFESRLPHDEFFVSIKTDEPKTKGIISAGIIIKEKI